MELGVWTERYRPKLLADVIGQEHVVERLKAWIRQGSIPNMLFAGRAGVGKTTIALCVAHELYGDHWRENFLETNASDERGIDVVRGKIKEFARTKAMGNVPFKVVFLDECDALTPEAQQALRRTMERFSNVCRFILSCNYSSRLIEPIQSRTAVFRFRALKEDEALIYLKNVTEKEKITAEEGGLQAVFEISEGDLRKATNILQASAALGAVTKEVVFDVASRARPEDVKEMLNMALGGNFAEARKKLLQLIISQGFSGEDLVKEIHRTLFESEIADEKKLKLLEIADEKKLRLLGLLGETEFRLNQGGSPDIQLTALLAQLAAMKG